MKYLQKNNKELYSDIPVCGHNKEIKFMKTFNRKIKHIDTVLSN